MLTSCPFANLIDRTNRAVIDSLCNVTVIIGGVQTQAVFDDGYSAGMVGESGMGGMANSQPAISVLSSLVPECYEGAQVLVNEQPFWIAEVQPDGLGVSRVVLQAAA